MRPFKKRLLRPARGEHGCGEEEARKRRSHGRGNTTGAGGTASVKARRLRFINQVYFPAPPPVLARESQHRLDSASADASLST
jgi:hypothetical protein